MMELKAALETREAPHGVYRLDYFQLDQINPVLLRDWDEYLKRNPSNSPMHDRRMLDSLFAGQQSNVWVYFLYSGDSICGVATLVLKQWPVKCQLGEITLAALPVRRLCLLGRKAHFPEGKTPYELLFTDLLSRQNRFDALYLQDVDLESTLWEFARTSPLVNQSLTCYVPDTPAPRILLHLTPTFDEYLAEFSSKHRKNLRRAVQTLEKKGDVRCVRYTNVDQVDELLDNAVAISQKTYQWNLLGLGLRGDMRERFEFQARQGWLRSYLLFVNGAPVSFILGFQYGSHFFLDDMGYDPQWRDFSVGKILQLKVVEDLFAENRPEVYDLGEYGPHKEEFGTGSYPQGKMFLFRRGVYPGFVRTSHRISNGASTIASALLERFELKKRLKKLIRMRKSR